MGNVLEDMDKGNLQAINIDGCVHIIDDSDTLCGAYEVNYMMYIKSFSVPFKSASDFIQVNCLICNSKLKVMAMIWGRHA
jgi:hypothetical protein